MYSHEPNRIGLAKFGRKNAKKIQGRRGLPGERGERGLQGLPGEGFMKTPHGDSDIDSKLIRNAGTPLSYRDAVTMEYLEDICLEHRNNIKKHFDYEISILRKYAEDICLNMAEDLTKYIRSETQKLQKILPDQYFPADSMEMVQLAKYRQI